MTKTYEELEEASKQFAEAVVQDLSESAKRFPQESDQELAPPIFPGDALKQFYRMSMMRSLLLCVPVEPPPE